MLTQLKTAWAKRQLKLPEYQFLFEPPEDSDWVCFDCETTGLDIQKDKIISLSAIKIRGNEILTSQSLNLRFKQTQSINPDSIVIHRLRNMDTDTGLSEHEAIKKFLEFIGSRPLVGYYLEFDVAMVNALVKPWLGIHLPNPQTDISSFYTDLYYKPLLAAEHEVFDLSFAAMLKKSGVPKLNAHDAFNDALMTAMLSVKMQALLVAKKNKLLNF